MIRGYRAAQWTTSAFGFLAAVLSIVFFRGVGPPGHKKVKPPPPAEEGKKETVKDSGEEDEKGVSVKETA